MENANEERKFLHDIASPAASITLVLDTLLDELKDKSDFDQGLLKMLGQALSSAQKITQLLVARRELLIQRSANDGKN
jgi:hypothetical protein